MLCYECISIFIAFVVQEVETVKLEYCENYLTSNSLPISAIKERRSGYVTEFSDSRRLNTERTDTGNLFSQESSH